MFKFFKKKPSNLFVYKWGILAGVLESLLILLSAFTLTNLYDLFQNNQGALMVSAMFYLTIAVAATFLIIFGMPMYLAFRKKMFPTALTVLLLSLAVLMIFFTTLFLLYLN